MDLFLSLLGIYIKQQVAYRTGYTLTIPGLLYPHSFWSHLCLQYPVLRNVHGPVLLTDMTDVLWVIGV